MKNRNLELSRAQWIIRTFDLESCKMLNSWLTKYIKLLEADVSQINKTIKDIGLSNRAYNVLKVNGIDSIQQLLIVSNDWNNIRALKGAGRIVVKEIQEKVGEFQNTYVFKGNS
jgi:DNA-directed RNA polymerase alpha subunit